MQKYRRAGQASRDNMAHAHCMLGTEVYKHSPRIFCFSTATVVARTRLSVILYVRYPYSVFTARYELNQPPFHRQKANFLLPQFHQLWARQVREFRTLKVF